MAMFHQTLRSQKGTAAIEFSVLLSTFLLIIFVIVDFGTFRNDETSPNVRRSLMLQPH